MNTNMAQYKDLFVETAKGYLATLNTRLLQLEKEPGNSEAIEAVFQAAHSLKGQSAAMGYEQTGYLCHVIEDAFYAIKERHSAVEPDLADSLFQAFDSLSESVAHIEAEGSELSVSDMAEQLKHRTGTQTVGTGRSSRSEQTPPVPNVSAPPTDSLPGQAAPWPGPTKNDRIRTIPVKVDQLDDIVGSIEELMVNRLTARAIVRRIDDSDLSRAQDKMDELIELLQFQVMKIRTVPLNLILGHLPRAVRDLGRILNKQIELYIEGADLELDRTLVEQLNDPLTHLIRNAADHGISERGRIIISAHEEHGSAVISVSDNGGGIDWRGVAEKAHVDPNNMADAKKALFSGVTTTTEATLVSGRGVGLETVKKTVEGMGGTIDVSSAAGQGATFTLKLPLNVSIVRTLIVQVGAQRYAIAATVIDRSIQVSRQQIMHSIGQEVFRYADQEIPLIRLQHIFKVSGEESTPDRTYAVIIHTDGEQIALAVDAVNETLETVIRPLPKLLRGSHVFSGVAVVGDGSSVLLLNPGGFSYE